MDLRVGGKYKVSKKLGSGAFGEIYHGTTSLITIIGVNVKTSEEVAIKFVVHFIKIIGVSKNEASTAYV